MGQYKNFDIRPNSQIEALLLYNKYKNETKKITCSNVIK